MHNEERSPFTPPPARQAPTLLIVFAVGVVAFAGYRLAAWWSARGEAGEPVHLQPGKAMADGSTGVARLPVPAPAQDGLPRTGQAAAGQTTAAWSRCESGGRVSYSDRGCADGVQTSRSDTTQAALSTVPSTGSTAGASTVYRCKSYSGAVFWSSTHCGQKKALIDRMVEVPRGLGFQDQVVVAERSLAAARQAAHAAPVRVAPAPAVVDRRSECRELDEEVRRLDAYARQPLSGHEQDRVRGKRKTARDRQFVLHC